MVSTRRRVLAGATTGVAVALAGCRGLGGRGGGDGGTDGPLSIPELVFAAEEPERYGEYDPQPDATYGASDTVWVYFEPTGVATEPVDGGERFRLSETLTIVDPDGETLKQRSFTLERTVADRAILDQLFLINDYVPGSPPLAGEYTSRVELTDEIDGQTATAEGTFAIAGEGTIGRTGPRLMLGKIQFCAGEPSGYKGCEPQPNARYEQGATIWLYIDVDGIRYLQKEKGKATEVIGTIQVRDETDSVVFEDSQRYSLTAAPAGDLSTFFVAFSIPGEVQLSPGEYTVSVTVNDRLGGKATVSDTFTVASGGTFALA